MTNNDVLRSLRYALNLRDRTLRECFALAGVELHEAELWALLKREQEPGFEPLSDALLSRFLDGLITLRRGKREGAAPPEPQAELSNNRILRALRIALELKDGDLLDIMALSDTPVSKAELSALFRRPDHRNYQPCGNQFLRNFLRGLARWYRRD